MLRRTASPLFGISAIYWRPSLYQEISWECNTFVWYIIKTSQQYLIHCQINSINTLCLTCSFLFGLCPVHCGLACISQTGDTFFVLSLLFVIFSHRFNVFLWNSHVCFVPQFLIPSGPYPHIYRSPESYLFSVHNYMETECTVR